MQRLKLLIFICCVIFLTNFNLASAQIFFVESLGENLTTDLFKITISFGCTNSCNTELICTLPFPADHEISMGPDGNLYVKADGGDIYLIDTLNCNATLYFSIFNFVAPIRWLGMASPIQDIFYLAKSILYTNDSLYKVDVINNQIANLGYMPYYTTGDLLTINGECIYTSGPFNNLKIVKMDYENPSNTIVI
jgi:hypothetical protein